MFRVSFKVWIPLDRGTKEEEVAWIRHMAVHINRLTLREIAELGWCVTPDDFYPEHVSTYPGFEYSINDGSLYFFEDIHPGYPEHLAQFLHAYLKKFRFESEFIGFEWSCTDSDTSEDSSGGAYFITHAGIKEINSYSWLRDQEEQFYKELEEKNESR